MQNKESFKSLQLTKIPKRQSFRIKISQPLQQSNRSKTAQTDYLSRIATSRQSTQSTSRNSTLWQKEWPTTEKRRENKLNSMFRIRKQKLQQITRENKNLYVRLNTQQSHYTHRQLRSKQKDSSEQGVFTFRTVDMKESRQILGPIGNFTGLRLEKKEIDNQGKQNSYQKMRDSVSMRLKQRESQGIRLSIRRKLGFINNQQQSQQISNTTTLLLKPSIKYFQQTSKQNTQISSSSILRTSINRQSILPQIYKLF